MMIRPPHSVVLAVGREDFTPPSTFDGATCVATVDCVAVAVVDVTTSATRVHLSPGPVPDGLLELGGFRVECEGLLSLRDVFGREYDSMGLSPGLAVVTVWGSTEDAPRDVLFQAREA